MSASITDRYAALVEAGAIERDPAQVAVVKKLQALTETLAARRLARKGSALGWLFGKKPDTAAVPKGLYVWGSVAVTALCMIAEPMLVARGRKQLIARLRRQQRSEKSECSERSESSARRFR